jgi:hypothetical protein
MVASEASRSDTGGVTRLRVEEVEPNVVAMRPERSDVAEPQPESPTPAIRTGPEIEQVRMVEIMRAVKMVLSVRAILALTIAGGIAVGLVAVGWPSWTRLSALIAYGVFVVGPVAFLETRRSA